MRAAKPHNANFEDGTGRMRHETSNDPKTARDRHKKDKVSPNRPTQKNKTRKWLCAMSITRRARPTCLCPSRWKVVLLRR